MGIRIIEHALNDYGFKTFFRSAGFPGGIYKRRIETNADAILVSFLAAMRNLIRSFRERWRPGLMTLFYTLADLCSSAKNVGMRRKNLQGWF